MTKYTLYLDTEFAIKKQIDVLSVQILCPEFNNQAYFIDKSEFTPAFNPLTYPIRGDITYLIPYEDDMMYREFFTTPLNDKFNLFYDEYSDLALALTDKKECNSVNKKLVKEAIKNGEFDEIFSKYSELNLSVDNLKITNDRGYLSLEIDFPTIDITMVYHYTEADLFKCFGEIFHPVLLNAPLHKNRVIKGYLGRKINTHPLVFYKGNIHEVLWQSRDTMFRLPPGRMGLDYQCNVYQAEYRKLNIETLAVAKRLGFKNVGDIKANMDILRKKFPILFRKYAMQDVFATWALDQKQLELYNNVQKLIGVEPSAIKDTTGSNCNQIVSQSVEKYFNPQGKEQIDSLKSAIRNGGFDKLQKIPGNDFGIFPFRTVGGLLFTRVGLWPYLQGEFGDLDLESCYATKLSNMSFYFGTPIVYTCKSKNRPILKDFIAFKNKHELKNDAWFVRVTGELKEAINTLILSDVDFSVTNRNNKIENKFNRTKIRVMAFDAYKTSDNDAESTLFRKKIKFGLVNQDILNCIDLLPKTWRDEYYNLKIHAMVFIPNHLICSSLEEYLAKQEELKDTEERQEYFDPKKMSLKIEYGIRPENVCLEYPIRQNISLLKDLRKQLKNESNPAQLIIKLINNSTYGVTACLHLKFNNLLAANMITAAARSAAWTMVNALNGYQTITDGCTFNWQKIPIGQTFKKILKSNPEYLLFHDDKIKNSINILKNAEYKTNNGVTSFRVGQKWINENFKKHLYKFYGTTPQDSNHPLNLFKYELKTETFETIDNHKVITDIFNEFYNTNAGNYVKGMDGNLEGKGFKLTFNQCYPFIKSRGFAARNEDFIKWYIESLKEGYTRPFCVTDRDLIKFSDANNRTVKYLTKNLNKFYTKLPKFDRIAYCIGTDTACFKMPKLISRSQFIFNDDIQLKNFEKQATRLSDWTKAELIGVDKGLDRNFWKNLTNEDLRPFAGNMIDELWQINPDINYHEFNHEHPIGLGFEMLCLKKRGDVKNIQTIRILINDLIKKGCKDFNAALQIKRDIADASQFKNFFASVIVKKANEEYRFINILLACEDNPMNPKVTIEQVRSLQEHEINSDPNFYE